jgi:hypothetical protein
MRSYVCLTAFFGASVLWAEQPHWAFQSIRRPTLPTVRQDTLERHPIDRLLLEKLSQHGLSFAPPADRATWLRRVTLDLIGVPPTSDELHQFLNDSTPTAEEKVVDRLLNDPRYGERWARHWMDVWRYSDWYGRRAVPDVMNSYPQIWRWRDWIIRSLNQDRGYDRMIQEMLAADEICPDDIDQLAATGFLVRNWFKWNYNQWMRDNVEHVGKAFLGLTLNCCHCHDHKYDPITQEEYFRFRAFFEPLELRHERVAGEPDPGPFKKYVYGEAYGPITSGAVRVFDEKLDAPTYMYSGGDERNRLPDRAPVLPGVPRFLGLELPPIIPVSLPASVWYPGSREFVIREEISQREQTLAKAKAAYERRASSPIWPGVWDLVKPDRLVAWFEFTRAQAELAAIQSRIAADRVTRLGQSGDAAQLARTASWAERKLALETAWLQWAKLLPAKDAKALASANKSIEQARQQLDVPSTIYTPLSPEYPKVSTGRRTALAKWITRRDHPLTARVAVNHIWKWHFGRPIVGSTFDFGRKGQKPTHPELLDWLASELIDNGWRFKPLHRQIVLSAAYRQQSAVGDAARARSVDPDNKLLWRFPIQRMEAEVVRDSLLAVAGELDPTMGGPEIPHEQGQTSKRRSLYFAHHGEGKMKWLEIFDAANPCDCYQRSASIMPQQALALSNSDLSVQCGRRLAEKLSAFSDDTAFVTVAFETILNRPPRATEISACLEFLGVGGNSRELLIHALLNHNDFVTIR